MWGAKFTGQKKYSTAGFEGMPSRCVIKEREIGISGW
jgi:hypothetical protein